jgi:hypothetical protein
MAQVTIVAKLPKNLSLGVDHQGNWISLALYTWRPLVDDRPSKNHFFVGSYFPWRVCTLKDGYSDHSSTKILPWWPQGLCDLWKFFLTHFLGGVTHFIGGLKPSIKLYILDGSLIFLTCFITFAMAQFTLAAKPLRNLSLGVYRQGNRISLAFYP